VTADVIEFNIPGAGVHTISPATPLPNVTRPVTIDGASEPGYTTTPLIELNGMGAGSSASGLRVVGTANGTVIRALAVNRFARRGIVLLSDGNRVQGCYVGTNTNGTLSLPNGWDGVAVLAGSANNLIGGTGTAARNVLSGNNRAGLLIAGAGATGNRVRGNFVGVDGNGTSDVGNVIGVWVSGGASANTVGGTTAGRRNVVSGNAGPGVLVDDAGTNGNAITGNLVGLAADGTSSVPNRTGILIGAGAKNTTAQSNVLSGNLRNGAEIEGPGSNGNAISGNRIGLAQPGSLAAPNGLNGVLIRDGAKKNKVRANVISGNTLAGVRLQGAGTSGNQVRKNFIGTGPGGNSDRGNDFGVLIANGASGNDVFERNIISGNDVRGVDIADAGTNANLVRNNYIGLNAAGTAAIPNPNGVFVHNGASGTRIGGTAAADRNVISGNTGRGIEVSINAPSGTLIQGNYIGLNAAGTAAVPNSTGIILLAGATGTRIGGTAAGAGNVVSGNTGHGVFVGDSTTVGTVIQGNRIGTNAAGTAVVANGDNGVHVAQSAQNVLVGGGTSAGRNLISGNANNGVAVTGSATNIRVQGNYIGTNAAGSAVLGNAIHGVAVAGAAHDNLIGGTAAGARNTIADNGGDGILIGSDATQAALGLSTDAGANNAAPGNRIFANGGLAIDLGPNEGVTANDANDVDTGANGLQNFPVLDLVTSGGSTFVQGSLDSLSNRWYRLEFYADSVGDPSGHGEGRTFLGARSIFFPSGADTVEFEYVFPTAVGTGTLVSATATPITPGTGAFGGTSELSLGVSSFGGLASRRASP
jgi:hypothetical protein